METSTCLMTPNHRLFLLSLGVGHWLASLYGSSESLYQPHWRLVKPASRLQWDRAIEWRSQCSVNRGLCSFGRGSFVLQLYTSPTWILWIWTGASFSTYALSCWKEETQVSKEEMSETGFPKMTQYIIFNSRKACLYFWDPEEKPSDFSQCQFPLIPWSSSLTKC